MMNTLLIEVINGCHIFFNYYPENDGSGYFSLKDGKPTALAEIKIEGEYLTEVQRGNIWGKMIVNSPDFNKAKCIKNIKHEISLGGGVWYDEFLKVVEGA